MKIYLMLVKTINQQNIFEKYRHKSQRNIKN